MKTLQVSARSSRKIRSGGLTTALLAAFVAAIFISGAFTSRAQSLLLPSLNVSATQQGGNAQESTPSRLTVVFSNAGLSPANATVLAGKVLLKVENRKPLERLTLRINRQGGELVREVALPDKATEWNTELELSAGQYVITETTNTGGSCVITAQVPPAG